MLGIEVGLTTNKGHEGVLILRLPIAVASTVMKVLHGVTVGCDLIWCVDCDLNSSW